MSPLARILMVLLPSFVIASALFSVPALIFNDRGLPRLQALGHRLDEIQEQNDVLSRENELLERRIRALREDPRHVEWIARRELGLVRPDELVFHF
jgi:cell division protein FtsB